jgi:competence CoiA-like predicted nuclease
MDTALSTEDKKEITADEADAKGVTRAICLVCKQDVRLHRGKKIAHHFEHLPSDVKCRLRHHRHQRP